MKTMEGSFRQELKTGDAALAQEIAQLRKDMDNSFAEVRQDIRVLTRWAVGLIATVIISVLYLANHIK